MSQPRLRHDPPVDAFAAARAAAVRPPVARQRRTPADQVSRLIDDLMALEIAMRRERISTQRSDSETAEGERIAIALWTVFRGGVR